MPAAPELDSIVLIVEDEALIRVALADFLQDVGFKVLEAANANEAVEIIEKASVPIDLVFTDVRMPGTLDGIELAHWIRTSRPPSSSCRVIWAKPMWPTLCRRPIIFCANHTI
jgi:CheY-like chemotaxis protein